MTSADGAALSQALQQIQALIKFVALNYLAVVKAVKKRNRHFKVGQRWVGQDDHHALAACCLFASTPRPAAAHGWHAAASAPLQHNATPVLTLPRAPPPFLPAGCL